MSNLAEKAKTTKKPAKSEKVSHDYVVAVEDLHSLNVYQKLVVARRMVNEAQLNKTGKNMHMEFKYFKLDDIVPIATDVFYTLGLVLHFDEIGTAGTATQTVDDDGVVTVQTEPMWSATVINADNPSETISWRGKYTDAPAIKNSKGGYATTPIQAAGSSITYWRRYVWLIVLDIVEPDTTDSTDSTRKAAKGVAHPHIPPTSNERQAIADKLTNANPASQLILKSLETNIKSMLKAAKGSEVEETATKLAAKAKNDTENFTAGATSDVETLITAVTKVTHKAGK